MSQTPRVTVVTVTYASAATVGGFLDSCPTDIPVLVVDNASPDDTLAVVRATRPSAGIIANGRNLGFGAACNLGLGQVRTDYALLANPDARLTAAAISTLLAAADAHPAHRLVAPLLLDGEGHPVRSWNVAQARRRTLPRDRDAEPWPEGPTCVAFASGACLLLRPSDGPSASTRASSSSTRMTTSAPVPAAPLLEPAARVAHAGGRSSPPPCHHLAEGALHGLVAATLRRTARQPGRGASATAGAGSSITRQGARSCADARPRRVVADLAGLAGTLAWLRGRH